MSSYLDGPNIEVFLEAIAELREFNFIWKYEADNLKDLPKNLLIRDWMPQNNILGVEKRTFYNMT